MGLGDAATRVISAPAGPPTSMPLEGTTVKLTGSPSWTLIVSVLWSVLVSLCCLYLLSLCESWRFKLTWVTRREAGLAEQKDDFMENTLGAGEMTQWTKVLAIEA